MDEYENDSTNVVDFHSILTKKSDQKFDVVSLSIAEEMRELLRMIPDLAKQNELDDSANWVAYYFGLLMGQQMLKSLDEEGFGKVQTRVFFMAGLHDVLDEGVKEELEEAFSNEQADQD